MRESIAPITTALSNADLPFFFEARHHHLAEGLGRIGGAVERAGHDDEAIAQLARDLGARHGLYALLVPEAAGGFPVGKPDARDHVDLRGLCLVREMLGFANPTADSIFAVQGLGSYPIVIAGRDAQRAAYLPGIIEGKRIGAFALTEPEAGSDVASMRTLARRDGDDFVLDGEKIYISNVGIASHYIVFANAHPAEGRRGITAFIVDRGTPGVTEERIGLSVEHPFGRLRFEGARIPQTSLLGAVGEGFKIAMRTLDTFRVSVGAAAVGMARRAIEASVSRLKTRAQFGKSLAEQPVLQAKIADMVTDFDAARLLVLRAAYLRDTSEGRTTRESAMAKLYATEAAQRIIDEAVQIHGGSGVCSGSIVERLYREIRPLRIYEGTSEIQRAIIGAATLA